MCGECAVGPKSGQLDSLCPVRPASLAECISRSQARNSRAPALLGCSEYDWGGDSGGLVGLELPVSHIGRLVVILQRPGGQGTAFSMHNKILASI